VVISFLVFTVSPVCICKDRLGGSPCELPVSVSADNALPGKPVIPMLSATLASVTLDPLIWSANWAWSLPLIVLTAVIHVLGLGLITRKIASVSNGVEERRYPTAAFAVIMGATTLSATILHGAEAAIWAAAYRLLGALPDQRTAMLYSLNAIPS